MTAQKQHFDLIIIGGGITGAGILLDAVQQGLSVLLLEKRDFAWGTSSRSTKLIHGGLRYLKQFEIGLVRETGKERARLYKNAPHLVQPIRMLLPIVKNGQLGQLSSSIGLWIYDWLAEVAVDERRRMLDTEETLRQEPLLKGENIIGGGLYYEYRTDDARLTIEVIKTALSHGAHAINHAEVTQLVKESGHVVGVSFQDKLSGEEYELRSRAVVNASGPWVDKIRKLDVENLGEKRLQLTKGVHLVVPYEKLPVRQACYFDVPGDKRMIFVIPRGRCTYFGTTDTLFNANIDEPQVHEDDVSYLLQAVNETFVDVNLTKEHIESSWVGLRPLIYEEGKGPGELSRKDEIFISKSGLISIAGGKLTGYRLMAKRTVNKVLDALKRKRDDQKDTLKLKLLGGQFKAKKRAEVETKMQDKYRHLGIKDLHFAEMFSRYGLELERILKSAQYMHHTGLELDECLLRSEVRYTCQSEMVMTLADFYLRRSGWAYFDLPKVFETLDVVSSEIARFHGLDSHAIRHQKDELEKQLPLSFMLRG